MARAARPPRHAFTLVELLVVIGIIALLIGILLPVLGRAREAANATACATTLRQLGVLMANYTTEFKGSLPYGRYTINNYSPAPGGTVDDGQDTNANRATYVWWSVLRKYMKTGGTGNWDNAVKQQVERAMGAFNCPTAHERSAGCDYGCNPVAMPDRNYEGDVFNGVPPDRGSPNGSVFSSDPKHIVSKPATTKSLYPDNVVLWDACEIPPTFSTQYVIQYGLDGTRMSDANKYYYRFRGNPNIANIRTKATRRPWIRVRTLTQAHFRKPPTSAGGISGTAQRTSCTRTATSSC